jgi:hypothetical protein
MRNMQGLNREELEDYVIDLYYNQKKTFREIQRIVRKSPRDLRKILDKVEPERTSLSKSSRAYQLFEDGSHPIQVAIALDLRDKEVGQLYKEWWNLNGMYQVHQVYEELGNDIWAIAELNSRRKAEGLDIQQVSRIIKSTTTLEYKIRDLVGEQARLEVSNRQAAKTFQQFTDSIQKDRTTLEENEYIIIQQKREIENLEMKKTTLENSNNSIQLNNETNIKIKQIVKQEIENVVLNPRKLLKLALASLFQSSRKHPGKLQALYYNTSPLLSVEQIMSQPHMSQSLSSHGYAEDEDEKLLLDDAEEVYNSMMDAIANRCINEVPNIPNDTGLPFETFQVGGIQGIENKNEIFDTKDLSEINLSYNNITIHVYPFPKITNGKNMPNEMDDLLIENECEHPDL